MFPKISLCMVVRNEELLIANAINSVKPIVSEIIVVDTGSSDQTCKIAASMGARIIRRKWDKNFGKMRNISIKNASGDWILVLDADESISKSQLPMVLKLTKNRNVFGYNFLVRNYTRDYDLLRDWYVNDRQFPKEESFSKCPGWSKTKCMRMFRKNNLIVYDELISPHESFNKAFLTSNRSKVKQCEVVVHHFQFLKGVKFVFKKQLNYLKQELKTIDSLISRPIVYYNIASTLFSLGRDKVAIKYLKNGIRLYPHYFDMYLLLGIVYKEIKRYSSAVRILKKAINLNLSSAEARIVLGMVYDLQRKFSDAKIALNQALKLKPKHPLAHNSLGVVYKNQGELNKARKEFRKAIEINPYCKDFYTNLSSVS